MDMALDLIERLKISEGRTQPIGADVKMLSVGCRGKSTRHDLTEGIGEVDIVDVDKGNTSPTSRFIIHE